MIRMVRVAVAEVMLIVFKTKACQANTDLVCRGPSYVFAIRYAPVQPAFGMQRNQPPRPNGWPAGMVVQTERIHLNTLVKLPLEPQILSCVACPKLSRIGLLDEV